MIKDVDHRFRWCERASAHDSDLAVTIYDAAGGIADNGAYVIGRDTARDPISTTTKPFQKNDGFENSTKMTYSIIFGVVRPKEDTDD